MCVGCVLCPTKRHKHTPHTKKHGGSNLLSHTPPSAVPSAQTTLATGFEKDTGRNLAAITTATTKTPTNHHTVASHRTVNANTQISRKKQPKQPINVILAIGPLVPVN